MSERITCSVCGSPLVPDLRGNLVKDQLCRARCFGKLDAKEHKTLTGRKYRISHYGNACTLIAERCIDCGYKLGFAKGIRCADCRRFERFKYSEARKAAGYKRPKRYNSRSHRSRAREYGVEYVNVDPREVFERDSYICYLCKLPTNPNSNPGKRDYPTMDHVVPISKGGPHVLSNLRTACWSCNSAKGAN